MKTIVTFIEEQKQEFATLPLFVFMQDTNINPRQRLIFAPCMAYFIMSFGDINKYILRSEGSTDKIQDMVNRYTYEDENHWPWFLKDIEILGFDPKWNFTQALRFIWGEQTKISRQLAYQIAGYTLQADSAIKALVIQVLEATADVFFRVSNQIALELQAITNKEYLFFGETHVCEEIGHVISTANGKDFLTEIELTDSQRQQAIEVVEKVFQVFREWTYELLAYANTHNLEPGNNESEANLMVCV